MSKHILLVSYDDRLLVKQRMLLEKQGYEVASALGLEEVKEAAASSTRVAFDLFILGLSIPPAAKKEIIEIFRRHCRAPILSLWGRGEPILDAVNYFEFSNKPDDLVRGVATILAKGDSAAGRASP
jgi:DNA-binding response OmpR family regulator